LLLAVMVAGFAVSSTVVGPTVGDAITGTSAGEGAPATPPGSERHEQHGEHASP